MTGNTQAGSDVQATGITVTDATGNTIGGTAEGVGHLLKAEDGEQCNARRNGDAGQWPYRGPASLGLDVVGMFKRLVVEHGRYAFVQTINAWHRGLAAHDSPYRQVLGDFLPEFGILPHPS